MADNTGAPHFIPYVEPTDLVREYPAADEASAFAVAAALDGIPVLAGIGSNVVQTVKTDSFTTSSPTFVPVTDYFVTITPTAASSKVLVIAQFMWFAGGGNHQQNLVRNSTNIYQNTLSNPSTGFLRTDDATTSGYNANYVFLDSPATTSATTYSLEVESSGTFFFGRRGFDNNFGGPASITAIEVAA